MTGDIAIWPQAASTTADGVDRLFVFLFAACGGVGLLVGFLLFYFSIKYRRRPEATGNPPATRQSRLLEWGWTLTPIPIFIIMYWWGGHVYFTAMSPPEDAQPVFVVAKQWMWKFQHPEGQREINTLHVPMGRPIKLVMTSEDVIHSFFVPEFRAHMDVLPRRYTSVWFQANRRGVYNLYCSQYCGTNHAGMTGQIIVMHPAEYQRWLSQQAEGSLALEGRKLFLKYRCVSCHSADSDARAPVLENLFDSTVPLRDGEPVRADYDYLRRSIMQPSEQIVLGFQDVMPPFEGQLSEEQVIALIAYIRSLGHDETPDRVEDFPPPARTPAIGSEEKAP